MLIDFRGLKGAGILIQMLYIGLSIMSFQFEGGSWTSPYIEIVEEWRVDPYAFLEDGQPSKGIASTVYDDSGTSWRLTLIDEENAYVISQNGSVETVPYQFDAEIMRFSPDGLYCVMYDIYTDQCARLDLQSGDIEIFHPFQTEYHDGYRYPMIRVTNSGSLIVLHYTNLRLYDSDLNVVVLSDDHYSHNSSIGYSDNGNLVCVSNGDVIEAYNESGDLLWTYETVLLPTTNQYGRVYVSHNGVVV